jgi:single-stranded-DNA-specific exonuclease
LQLFIKSKNKIYKGIAFGKGDLVNKIKESKGFDILYSIENNNWNGKDKLQLVIVDLKLN